MPKQNFRELLNTRKIGLMTLARLMVTPAYELRKNLLFNGRATPQEVQRIAEVLGCAPDEVTAALAETVRRPGERDPRGRKKALAEGVNAA